MRYAQAISHKSAEDCHILLAALAQADFRIAQPLVQNALRLADELRNVLPQLH